MKDHEIRELVNQLRDVAIKYHAAGQLREQLARVVRAYMLQAQPDDDGESTDDERIMAVEGIHNCVRCGDEGWFVGEMGITRCACGQAGNSPVITEEDVALQNYRAAMEGISHIRRTLEETFGGLHGTHVEPDVLMDCKSICDAIYAAYRGNSPVIPEGLIAAVNRLLDSDGSRGCYSAICCLDAREEVERLLAAAPQEVNHG